MQAGQDDFKTCTHSPVHMQSCTRRRRGGWQGVRSAVVLLVGVVLVVDVQAQAGVSSAKEHMLSGFRPNSYNAPHVKHSLRGDLVVVVCIAVPATLVDPSAAAHYTCHILTGGTADVSFEWKPAIVILAHSRRQYLEKVP